MWSTTSDDRSSEELKAMAMASAMAIGGLQEEIVELKAMAMQSNEENAALRAAVAKLQHEDGLLKWV